MSADLQVILDDNSAAFSYAEFNTSLWLQWAGGPFWMYKGTYHYPYEPPNAFTFTFYGTSAAFIGITPLPSSPGTTKVTVQIDNGTSSDIIHGHSDAQIYKAWFTTPTLPDGKHTITVTNVYNTSVDYAVIKVGSQTSLSGQTIIVDDDSSLIQYSGRWSRNTDMLTPSVNFPTGYPYGNVTHRSSNPGDSFTFRFSGTSIAIYGIFSWHSLGSLTSTYSIDGLSFSSSISVNTSSSYYLDAYREVANHLYFSQGSLVPGPHTLVVNITEAINHTFVLDYITYEPAFDTLSSMPSLSLGITSSTTTPTSSSRPSVSTGAIVGGIVGGLAFGLLVTILVLLILRRRRAREQDHTYPDAALDSGVNDPNMLSPYQMQEHSPNPRLQPAIGATL